MSEAATSSHIFTRPRLFESHFFGGLDNEDKDLLEYLGITGDDTKSSLTFREFIENIPEGKVSDEVKAQLYKIYNSFLVPERALSEKIRAMSILDMNEDMLRIQGLPDLIGKFEDGSFEFERFEKSGNLNFNEFEDTRLFLNGVINESCRGITEEDRIGCIDYYGRMKVLEPIYDGLGDLGGTISGYDRAEHKEETEQEIVKLIDELRELTHNKPGLAELLDDLENRYKQAQQDS